MTQAALFEVKPAPFLCRDATALGVSRRELMSERYRCDIQGTRVLADTPDSAVLRIRTARLVLREGSVFTGTTAAWLHGVFNPPPGSEVPVQLARGPDPGQRGTGCVGVRRALRTEDVTDIDGLPVLTPLRLAFEQARIAHHVQEAVAQVDAFVHAKLFSPKCFRRYVRRFHGYRGVKTARWAGELTRAGAESQGESRMRVQIVMAGLPEPELQISMRDGAGREFARLDAGYRNASGRVVLGLEYDGEVHRDPTRSAHDKARDARLLAEHDVECLRFNREDTFRNAIAKPVCVALALRGLFNGKRRYPNLPYYPWA